MTGPFEDPEWPRASSLLRSTGVRGGPVALVGAPLRLASITPGRCDLAPGAIRAALRKFSTYDLEHGIDLHGFPIADAGDLPIADLNPAEAFNAIVASVRALMHDCDVILLLGGDNSVTRPMVHGAATSLAEIGLVTLDAHLDVRSMASGLTNGNPIRALVEDGMPGKNIVQLGLQAFSNSAPYARYAKECGIRNVTVAQIRHKGMASVVQESLYSLAHMTRIAVDFDLDVLDRVWMPGAPGSRPGGLTPGELCDAAFLLGNNPAVVAADFVELDPTRDIADVSVMAAARCLLSFMAGVAARQPQ